MIRELEDIDKFSRLFLRIQDKSGNLIPLRLNDLQKQTYKQLTDRTLILKSRQIGISTLIQAEIFRRLITQPTSALTLTHNDTTTQLLRDISDRFYKNFPEFNDIEKPDRKIANARITKFEGLDSRHLIGTAGNEEMGRGGTYNIIHGSEVAFWKDAEQIISGAIQGGNPQVILESTANGQQGYFYELCMEALAGRGVWNLIFLPWYYYKEYQIENDKPIVLTQEEINLGLTESQSKWRRNKMEELRERFKQEYPENPVDAFLGSNDGYFSDIPEIKYYDGKENFDLNHKYTAGLDFGMSNDYTVMIVIDRTTRKMVDYLRINKTSWGNQRQEIKKMYNKWRLSGIRAETNSIGSPNIEELEADGVFVEHFNTTNVSKNLIMQQLHEALETGLELMNLDILRSELASMIGKQTPTGLWTISARTGHDDLVIALALANSARIGNDRKARSWQ